LWKAGEEVGEFRDASAVPLLVKERQREAILTLLEEDEVMLVWWGTPVECTSAIARRERDGSLTASQVAACLERLRLPEGPVRSLAVRRAARCSRAATARTIRCVRRPACSWLPP
jgi:hypothetical protein